MFDNIETIVEPNDSFESSLYISTRHPLSFNYVLNDQNSYMSKLAEICRDDSKIDDFIHSLEMTVLIDRYVNHNTFQGWVFSKRLLQITPDTNSFIYNPSKCIENIKKFKGSPIVNFFRTERIIFYKSNCIDMFNVYKHHNNTFIVKLMEDNSDAFLTHYFRKDLPAKTILNINGIYASNIHSKVIDVSIIPNFKRFYENFYN